MKLFFAALDRCTRTASRRTRDRPRADPRLRQQCAACRWDDARRVRHPGTRSGRTRRRPTTRWRPPDTSTESARPAMHWQGSAPACGPMGPGTFVNTQNTKLGDGIFAPYAVWIRRPSEVTRWNAIAMSTLVAMPPAAGGAPSALQINMGMAQGAVYDAINAITPKHHRPYLLKPAFLPMPRRRPLPRPRHTASSPTSSRRFRSAFRSRNRADVLQSLDPTIRPRRSRRYPTRRSRPRGSPRGTPPPTR